MALFWPCRQWFRELLQLQHGHSSSTTGYPPPPISNKRGEELSCTQKSKGLKLDAWKFSGLFQTDIRLIGFSEAVAWTAVNARRRSTDLANKIPDYGCSESGTCLNRQVLPYKISVMEVCEFLQRLIKSGKQVAATPKITDQRLPLYMKGLQVVPPWAPIIIKDNTSGERLIGHQWVSAIMELISAVLQAWIKSLLEWIFSASLATLTKKTLFLIEVASAIKRCLHALSSIKNNRITVDLRIAGLGWFQTLLSLLRTRSYPSCLGGGIFLSWRSMHLETYCFWSRSRVQCYCSVKSKRVKEGMKPM